MWAAKVENKMLFKLRVETIMQGGNKSEYGTHGRKGSLCYTAVLKPPYQPPLPPAHLLTNKPTPVNQPGKPRCKDESTDAPAERVSKQLSTFKPS